MSAVMLTLEGFAGQDVDQTIRDACRAASRVGCWVKINVNGIEVLIPEDCDDRIMVKNYHIARERGATFVSANVIPLGPDRARTATPEKGESHDG